MKKTGATPLVEEGIGGGEVQGVVEVRTVLVKYRDGHGTDAIRLAVVIPGGAVHFLDKDAIDIRPVQTWLKNGILAKLG